MINSDIRAEILSRLTQTEQQENVRILMAIESGSRAWGFASPNSDYDIRFIYARPADWYLAVDLEERRDVIEYPIVDDIDLNGWDVRKALQLFRKSNPSFVEWIQSPITYLERGGFRQTALSLLPDVYSIEKGIHHYRSMAKTNYRTHFQGKQVRLKKYLYILRALLSVKWLESYRMVAPIEFDELLTMVDDSSVLAEIDQLVAIKQTSQETQTTPAIPLLDQFIEFELARLANTDITDHARSDMLPPLNSLFHQVLKEENHRNHESHNE